MHMSCTHLSDMCVRWTISVAAHNNEDSIATARTVSTNIYGMQNTIIQEPYILGFSRAAFDSMWTIVEGAKPNVSSSLMPCFVA